MPDRSVLAGPRRGSLAARLAPRPIVLVIEDEPDIAAFLGAFFRASGLDLVHVNPHTTGEVMAAMREHQPSCVLLDLGLAGMSGLEVLDELAPAEGGPPVFVVTGDVRETTRLAVQARGAIRFVAKPYSVRELFGDVDAVVRQSAGRA